MLNDKADFYVHIDKKTSQSPFQSEVSQLSNVHFSEERYPVFWAGFNVIKATIALLHLCISSGKQYKKIVLLSGSDYPLVSNADIHAFSISILISNLLEHQMSLKAIANII